MSVFVNVFFLTLCLVTVSGKKCEERVRCSDCVSVPSCAYFDFGDRYFCGDREINPKVYLLKITRISGCHTLGDASPALPDQSSENGKLDKGFLIEDKKESTKTIISKKDFAEGIPNVVEKNDLEAKPFFQKRVQKFESPILIAICDEYTEIFKHLHKTRNFHKERVRCNRRLRLGF